MTTIYNVLSAVFAIAVIGGLGYAVGYLHGHSKSTVRQQPILQVPRVRDRG